MAETTATATGTGASAPSAAGGVGVSPRRYRRRLANLRNVRTALADVVDGLEGGRLDPGVARAMVYALATLTGVFREEREAHAQTVLEARIAALEAAAGPATGGRATP